MTLRFYIGTPMRFSENIFWKTHNIKERFLCEKDLGDKEVQ